MKEILYMISLYSYKNNKNHDVWVTFMVRTYIYGFYNFSGIGIITNNTN